MQGVLKLCSLCSGKSEDNILKAYQAYCESGAPNLINEDEIEESELQEQRGHEYVFKTMAADNECHEVLKCMQSETGWVDPDLQDEDMVYQSQGAPVDPEYEKVTCKESLDQLFENPDDAVPVASDKERLPSTLLEAMNVSGDAWNALFRLAVRLRSYKGGIDTKWVANARNARRPDLKLNWHQLLDQQHSRINV